MGELLYYVEDGVAGCSEPMTWEDANVRARIDSREGGVLRLVTNESGVPQILYCNGTVYFPSVLNGASVAAMIQGYLSVSSSAWVQSVAKDRDQYRVRLFKQSVFPILKTIKWIEPGQNAPDFETITVTVTMDFMIPADLKNLQQEVLGMEDKISQRLKEEYEAKRK